MTLAHELLKVAALARIELSVEERGNLSREFETIVAYFAELQKLTLEGEMALDYPCPCYPDVPIEYDIDIDKLSKHTKEGYFTIPPLFE